MKCLPSDERLNHTSHSRNTNTELERVVREIYIEHGARRTKAEGLLTGSFAYVINQNFLPLRQSLGMADAIYDPLSINLRRQTRLFLKKNLSYDVELSNTTSVHELLIALSRLLAKSPLTELIATTFRPILMDLCARWIEGDDCSEEQLIAIAFLVEPQEELYPYGRFFLKRLRSC